ncbi:MAG: SDR family NAD(P)-dependent oxidoreductase, partial [Cyanobacteria bacterium P01_E01_bin.34]
RRWLLFLDDLDVGAKLARRLQQDQQRIATVVKGDRFSLLSVPENNGSSQLVYALNPQEPADYRALLSDLQQRNCLPERIVHLWSLTQTSSFLSIDLNSRLPEGYASLLRLTAALDELDSCAAEIVVISTGLQDVSGTEIIQPDKAPILAACRVIPMEYETLTCRSIDILPPAAEMDSTVDLLEREIQAETAESAIAYRGSCRWLQSFDPVRLDSSNDSLLRPQGVYLITGGLGAVGTVLAEDLARSQQAKLILVSRTELPPRETWDVDNHPEAIQHKIQQIQHLESLGAEVWVTSADVTDREQMHDVVRKGRARFGTIHGVIHAAVTLNKQLIRDSEAALDLSTSAKVQGAVVLDRIFKDADLDFLLICSSQAAYLGGLRMVTYAAENVFLDAFAHHRTHHQHAYTLSVNWDRWTRPEQEEDSSDSRPPNLPAELRSGMTPEEGIEVFHRVLSQHLPSQIVISTQAWLALIDRTSTNLKSSLQALPEEWLQSQLPQTTHPRPELPTVYVAPRDEIEQALAELWQQVLGVTPVGIHDNFFDLGGDSLTATILVSQASKQFEIDVPARSFFQAPTVAGSAEIILDYLSEGNDDLMAAALAEIEGLSDEEVERELAQSEPREDVK